MYGSLLLVCWLLLFVVARRLLCGVCRVLLLLLFSCLFGVYCLLCGVDCCVLLGWHWLFVVCCFVCCVLFVVCL